MACPTCRRAKCVWIALKENPTEQTLAHLHKVLRHNTDYIEMVFRDGGSASTEERMIKLLEPYTEEIERRKKASK